MNPGPGEGLVLITRAAWPQIRVYNPYWPEKPKEMIGPWLLGT
jgi:hypothetical protein